MNRIERYRKQIARYLAAALCVAFVSVSATAAPPTAESLWTDKIKDMSAQLNVQETDRAELKKMGGSFATTYSGKRMDMMYQFPNKARFEGKVSGFSGKMIYNGDQKSFNIIGIRKTINTKGQPGQKQSLLDLGVFAKDYLLTDWEAKYERTENNLHVFKLVQRDSTNGSHEIVWVNPKTALIEKRVSYNGDNIIQKEIRYKNARQVKPGIWIPTRIEIYNREGKMGVAQSIDDIKVNEGVDSSLFNV